jgi:signal transduction histidine kinase
MRFEQLKAVFRSLRFRLMAWNTAVVLLMVIPTLAAVRESMRHALTNELDKLLKEDTLEVGLAVRQFYPDMPKLYKALDRKARGHAQHGWFVQIFDAGGNRVWSSPSTPAEQLPPLSSRPQTWDNDGQSYRLVQAPVEFPEMPRLTVRVGCSMQSLHEDFAILTRMMVLAGAAIVVLAPLGGYWLAGRATQPLARIIQTTARLRPTNLAERLPLRGTGDELDRLSRTINGMLDRIGAYVEENHDFLANAAHELRSPLTAIRSTVEVALNSERSPQEYQELLAEVAEVCDALGGVVNKLLLLGESETRRLVPEGLPVALESVVQKAVEMFQAAAENQQLELTLARRDRATVEGDEGHLWQVVNNLIDNALKFTPAGGKVDVSLRADADSGRAILTVRDTGVGIAAEELPRVFDRFYRGDRARGTGLGLSICQALVKAHQGMIQAESSPGQGSRFTVTLPLAGTRNGAAATDFGTAVE